MKIARQILLQHLEGVHCSGLIPEAVFSGKFAAVAKSGDGVLVVEANGLDVEEELEREAGFDLRILTSVLGDQTADEVEIGLSNRLFVGAGKISLALVTTDPANTITRVEDKALTAIKKIAEVEGDGYPLDPGAVKAFLKLQKALTGIEEVTVVLGKESGFRLGSGTEHQGQVALPGVSVKESSTRRLPAQNFKTVLEMVGPKAQIWFGPEPSPHSAVTIKDGTHTYYLACLSPE